MDTPAPSPGNRYIQAIYVPGQSAYAFDFPVYDGASVQLFVAGDQWAFPGDYSVAINGLDGGTVTLLRQPSAGQILTIIGATPTARTEVYSPPVPDVATMNVEGNKTVYRLQQLRRDVFGCLKNPVAETEAANTVLPPTADRSGKFAVWGSGTGRLTYAGDPTEGGDDPTQSYAKIYNNLSDLTDPAAARENLAIVQGHTVNGLDQRPNLILSGEGVSVTNGPDATTVSIVSAVRSFGDLAGRASIAQGGTGATNAADARKNLGLAKIAATGSFSDLLNRPPIVSTVVATGTGASLVGTAINGIVPIFSLLSDGTVGIRSVPSSSAVELSISSVPAGKVDGVLPPDHGGTGLGPEALAAGTAGQVLTLTSQKTFALTNGGTIQPSYHQAFAADDWAGSPEFSLTFPAASLPFAGSTAFAVTVRDGTGGSVLVPSAVAPDGSLTLFSWEKFSGTVTLTT